MSEAKNPLNGTKHIVVLDRGWVYVGDVTREDDFLRIDNAWNIRRWGTSKGLGELAHEGPKRNTQMDPAGIVRAPLRAVIALLDCSPAVWASATKELAGASA